MISEFDLGLFILKHKPLFIINLYKQVPMSFLFNIFSKNNKEELNKYDRITFKINLSDHIPQYYETSTNKPTIETEVTPDHPLYYTMFPKRQPEPQDDTYVNYTVK